MALPITNKRQDLTTSLSPLQRAALKKHEVADNAAATDLALCHGPMPKIAVEKSIFQVAPDKNRDVKAGDPETGSSKVIQEQAVFSNTSVPSDDLTDKSASGETRHKAKRPTGERRAVIEQQQARMDEEAAGRP